jgi:hypothetical protein
MSWQDIEDSLSPESKLKAEKAAAVRKQAESDIAKAYARCFASDDGKRVIADLTNRFIITNNTPLDAVNVNYVAAYKNGEKGVVNTIISLITKAEVI